MTKKEKFLKLVSDDKTNTVARAKVRQEDRVFTRLSQQIALAILERLDEINWHQKRLADAMGVSPQQVNKWVKGGENFTIETLTSLETVLNTRLIAVQPQKKQLQ